MFWNPASQLAPRVHYILTNISINSSWLTSLGQTYPSLGVGRGWRREAHSCQPLRIANRNSYIHQHSHGSAAPSQWRREKWESGCVRRQEGNNQWRSPRCFSQDGGAMYACFVGYRRANQSVVFDRSEDGRPIESLVLTVNQAYFWRVGGAFVGL